VSSDAAVVLDFLSRSSCFRLLAPKRLAQQPLLDEEELVVQAALRVEQNLKQPQDHQPACRQRFRVREDL
jgi:hypothetical protein